ncbi:MAG: methionyl-tRNA formyltransferase [Bacteroidetes bacterium]|nr:methionyl-tRNA formyltransferase [Bacteroidota bacterium]
MKIIFFGTPEFAVASLDMLMKNNYDVVGIVTAPDKPAGRGLEIKMSAVKEFAREKNLKVFQPENLKSEEFISQLKELNPDLGVVVAFRKMPEEIFSLPKNGTFNLHASLLPQYRGAAPINWAIINGEKESGVTTFFLEKEIDTGKIILRAKENIREEDTAGDLYERLMKDGADLVLKTVRAIETGNYTPQEQKDFIKPGEKLKPAPKIFKEDCRINWKESAEEIYDFIRGLSPYPTAFTEIKKQNEILSLKIFRASKEILQHQNEIASIHTDGKTFAKIAAKDGFINLIELQLAGRKKMQIDEFLRGFSLSDWKIIV